MLRKQRLLYRQIEQSALYRYLDIAAVQLGCSPTFHSIYGIDWDVPQNSKH